MNFSKKTPIPPVFRRLILLLLALFFSLGVQRAGAQSAARSQENRFLIVVETASAMRRSSNAVEQAVAEIFQTKMKGEFRPGDTIGIWTYSDRLRTEFPMQIWTETNGMRIQNQILTYLREQRYEKRAHLDKVLPTIGEVITLSRRLTVLFIFDGTEPIKGTPFDSDINALHKQFGSEFRSQNLPFVTVLAARNGNIFDYTVNTPGSITVPHTALPIPPAATNPPPVVEAKPPPLPAPTNIVVTPPPPRKRIEIVMAGPSAVAARSNVVAAPAPPPPIVPIPTPVVAPEVAAVTPSATNPPESPQALPRPATIPVLETKPAVAAAPITNAPTNSIAVAPPPSPPPANPVSTPARTASAAAPEPSSAPPVPAPAAPVVPVAPRNRQEIALFIIAFSLLAIAVALIWFLIRRGRGAGSPSLISQSMNRSR